MPRSLTSRLLFGSAVATLLALVTVLVLMQQVLTRFVTGQIDQRLDNKIVSLASQVTVASDGTVALVGEADGPPFDKRHHRSFWLVQGPRNTLSTAWLVADDAALPPQAVLTAALTRPEPPGPEGLPGRPRSIRGQAFRGTPLHERVALWPIGGTTVLILVAAPVAAIDGPVREAMTSVGLAVLALGIFLGGLALAQVRLGLRPLAALRTQVAQVAQGRRDRLPHDQPREVAPLVAEMNQLLDRNAANLEKARRHVANLAHGLKTPLATLQLGVARLDGPNKDEIAALVEQLDERVRHHLGRARAGVLAGPERARTRLRPRLVDLGDALRRIHADRAVTLILDAPVDAVLACEAHDVDEIFGNLLDNAFKFARREVRCTVRENGREVRVGIADDGDGLAAEDIVLAQQPGRRLDEQRPGFGFGLPIARELVELYGGDLRLEPGTTGLSAVVTLPSAGRRAT